MVKECGIYTTHFRTYQADPNHVKCMDCCMIWTNKEFERWGKQ